VVKVFNLGTTEPFCLRDLEWQWEVEHPEIDGARLPDGVVRLIGTMIEGEKCRIQPNSEPYGNPKQCKRDAAPEDMIYEVEVLRITEELEYAPLPGGGVTVRVLNSGIPGTLPTDFATVKIHLRCKVEKTGHIVIDTFDKSPLEFRLGSCDVMPGLEIAVRQLRVDERAIVKLNSTYAFGPFHVAPAATAQLGGINGSELRKVQRRLLLTLAEQNPFLDAIVDVPNCDPSSWLCYSPEFVGHDVVIDELMLLSVANLDKPWQLKEDSAKFGLLAELTDMAKELKRKKLYSRAHAAMGEVERCAAYLQKSSNQDTRQKAEAMESDLQLEIACLLYKNKQYRKAILMCMAVNELFPESIDGLLLQCKCLRQLEEFEDARTLLDSETAHPQIDTEKQKLSKAEKAADDRSSSFWKGKFSQKI